MNIEVAKTHGPARATTYLVDIGDDLSIKRTPKELFLGMNRAYGELTHYETIQLAGTLLAVETLTDTDDYEAMDTITTMLETMNSVREKFGHEPLVRVNGFYDDDTNRERVGYTVTMTRKDS